MYVSVPKAACTSLKWLVAGLAGEDPQRFYDGLSREAGRQMTIHIRSRWQHTPKLHDLDAAALAEIRPDNGWFIFGVVRHPVARLWSGWQSKFLLQETRFHVRYPDGPWPRVPQSTQDVVEDFHEFVYALTREKPVSVARDRHFRNQRMLLRTSTVDYTRIYRTDEMSRLLTDLEAHLAPLGLQSMPSLLRSNETPLPLIAAAIPDDVLGLIQKRFAVDFEDFGYDDPMPTLSPVTEYTSDQLAEVGRLVDRGERIGDLYELAMRSQHRIQRQARRIEALQAQVARAKPSGLDRVRARAWSAARSVKRRLS